MIPDSSVWIEFQRRPGSEASVVLDSLLASTEVAMVGPVMAEVLGGSRTEREFVFYRDHFAALDFLVADRLTRTLVSELAFDLKRQGQPLPLTDLLIAAIAMQHGREAYTLDRDFERIVGLRLYSPGASAQ